MGIRIISSWFLVMLVEVLAKSSATVPNEKQSTSYEDYVSKPNIIFVLADDLDVSLNSASVMRKTERLLRKKGVSFRNAFSTSPLCCPSRSSILSGRYAHNHHVNTNNKPNCSGTEWQNGPEKRSIGKLMQESGYRTSFFGKYLNQYKSRRIPPGWDNWIGLLGNSRYYNYTLNVNGRLVKHGADYYRDYFTNVITDHSIDYFTEQKKKEPDFPVFMMVSMSAPHSPDDSAPQYQQKFPDVKSPKLPNYNRTSLDKHWIIRVTPPLTKTTEQFTDILHRKRLQTLLSLDDSIERLHNMLVATNQVDNTYLVFSSDHGYHLGQFNQVKGKNQPYESDIRIPLYIRGPNIPVGVQVDDIALNIDFLPTFLDMGNPVAPTYKYIDGISILPAAIGCTTDRKNHRCMRFKRRDTFLVERAKLYKPIDLNLAKTCSLMSNRPPCTANKDFVCHNYKTWFVERCEKNKNDISKPCLCDHTWPPNNNKTHKKFSEKKLVFIRKMLNRSTYTWRANFFGKLGKASQYEKFCTCRKKWRRKKHHHHGHGGIHCFEMTRHHWRTPPYWTKGPFTSCNNAPNSTYWCLRTINKTHNFLYCEFITGFKEYYDMTVDPYQLTNTVATLAVKEEDSLHGLLQHMRGCRGSDDCRSGLDVFHNSFSVQSNI